MKSVDSVENPGHEHGSPVDNTSGAIVDSRCPLLESGALTRAHFALLIIEKLLVSMRISLLLPQYGISLDTGYPQSCQPFCEVCSAGYQEAAPSDRLPTGRVA